MDGDFVGRSGARDDSIGQRLLELSAALTGRVDAVEVGHRLLDEIAQRVEAPTTGAIVAAVFGAEGLRGDVEDYHAEQNSFLDRVLERRVGMPITLSAVVVEVGERVGVPLTMIGMPGHVIVGTEVANHFIDAFGGVEVNTAWVQKRFESIFGPDAALTPAALQPMSSTQVVMRVCNNLVNAWLGDRSGKLAKLLALRLTLPYGADDRRRDAELARAAGRYDLAARFHAAVDPDDPMVDALWARLN